MIIRARAPLRLGFAGGGTDVSPYSDNFGGACLNATIGRYAHASIVMTNDRVRFCATDMQCDVEKSLSNALEPSGLLPLHSAVYRWVIEHYHNNIPISLVLSTCCEAPPGSGLGSSSTLVVAMLQAFVELLHISINEYEVAAAAYHIEREICGFAGGRQDQYATTFGGINYMEFYCDNRVLVTPLRIKKTILREIESSILLYFTGVSRQSAEIIVEQQNNVIINKDAVQAMHGLKQNAIDMKESLLRGDITGIVRSLRLGWDYKCNCAKQISNQFIEQVYSIAIAAGALAGKVSGAGGGGFFIFFVPPDRRMDVIRALSAEEGLCGGRISNCNFTNSGVESWKVSTNSG